jgi:hypothetical protein
VQAWYWLAWLWKEGVPGAVKFIDAVWHCRHSELTLLRVSRRGLFDLQRRMLIDKWAGGLGMAFDADSILVCAAFQQRRIECAMRIMAVAALHQPLVHLVMKGLRESAFDIGVAAVA